ncbi:MAG TPA: hypothetical protein GXZ89_08795 [Fastidiosipila sp.]|jgi:hypothetical protein|nr:hypothetical protein [Fastidiosipila sp.]
MEHLLSIILVIMLTISPILSQGGEPVITPPVIEETEPPIESGSDEPPVAIDGYAFSHNSVLVQPTAPADDSRTLLDQALETGEAPSCAFEGLDKVYYFDGFEIQSGLVNNVEMITGVILVDQTVETREGLRIGMSKDEMLRIYGDDYRESFGQYIYEDDDVELILIVFNDEVISISYIGKFAHVS